MHLLFKSTEKQSVTIAKVMITQNIQKIKHFFQILAKYFNIQILIMEYYYITLNILLTIDKFLIKIEIANFSLGGLKW